MSYSINKTNGTLLIDLLDGTIDQTATDLTLIAKNVSNYGEYLNENFVKLLENFSATSAPNNPIPGQIWFDSSENRLKVYDGSGFRVAGGPVVSTVPPTNPVQGDLWIDSTNQQMYFYVDSTTRILAGPAYSFTQGTSGQIVSSITDTNGVIHSVVNLYCAGTLLGIFSKTAFTPVDGELDPSTYSGNINVGFNTATVVGLKWHGTATKADSLVSPSGSLKTTTSFMSTETNTNTLGTVTIQNTTPLIIGPSQNTEFRVNASSAEMVSNSTNQDFIFKIKNGLGLREAITIKANSERVGIFNSSPEYNLDVTGDVRVTGSLIVEGTATTVDTVNLTIADKVIELAKPSGTATTDSYANGGGFIVKGTTDHSVLWEESTTNFNTTENWNIATGKSYKINNVSVLSSTTLGSTVTASNLTTVGTLISLNVANLAITGSKVANPNSNGSITLEPQGTGTIIASSKRITSLATPTTGTDATTKSYVDTLVQSRSIGLSLDITGLNDSQIALVLRDIAPAGNFEIGTYAYVHCTQQTVTYSSINYSSTVSKTYVAVDKAGGSQNQSVLQDFSVSPINAGNGAITVTRSLKRFIISAGPVWAFDADLVSSV
jgi:hypothetical protein